MLVWFPLWVSINTFIHLFVKLKLMLQHVSLLLEGKLNNTCSLFLGRAFDRWGLLLGRATFLHWVTTTTALLPGWRGGGIWLGGFANHLEALWVGRERERWISGRQTGRQFLIIKGSEVGVWFLSWPWLTMLMNINSQPQGEHWKRGGEEASDSCPSTFNQHGKQNLTRYGLKTLAHRGTRVAWSTGAALVVDWGVPLCCLDKHNSIHVLIVSK